MSRKRELPMPEDKPPVNPPAAGAPEWRDKWGGTCGGPVTHWCKDCESRGLGLTGYYCQRHAAQYHCLSTACLHSMHESCRKQCKFCNALCVCPCHATVALPAKPDEPKEGDFMNR